MRQLSYDDLGLREPIEAALEPCLSHSAAPLEPRSQGAAAADAPAGVGAAAEVDSPASSDPDGYKASVLVGEVVDTHHPHLPGRVLVRWLDDAARIVERWLPRERHLSLRKADRVLITLPSGWSEWIVTGALARERGPLAAEAEAAQSLRLSPGETLRVLSHEGELLLTLKQGDDGPVIELGKGNVELAAARTLRLRGDTIELASGAGGIDLRTDGDTVVRARTIRLN